MAKFGLRDFKGGTRFLKLCLCFGNTGFGSIVFLSQAFGRLAFKFALRHKRTRLLNLCHAVIDRQFDNQIAFLDRLSFGNAKFDNAGLGLGTDFNGNNRFCPSRNPQVINMICCGTGNGAHTRMGFAPVSTFFRAVTIRLRCGHFIGCPACQIGRPNPYDGPKDQKNGNKP